MARTGMDVDQISAAGNALKERAADIDALVAKIDGIVRNMPGVWDGPDSQQFVNEWWPEHKRTLVAASAHVAGLGQSALNNASEQREVSGSSGGGIATPSAHDSQTFPSDQPVASPVQGPAGPQNYKVTDSISRALGEVGTSRPTGYNQEGECIKSVQRWINSAGGVFKGGGPVDGYLNSGAVPVDPANAAPGDVIQYTSTNSPNSWENGVHTVMVVGTNADGTLHIVQSNAGYTGKVSEVTSWTPTPPKGFEAKYWRFGQQ